MGNSSAASSALRGIKRRRKPHGIFCLESEWSSDLRDPSTVEPLLQMLRQSEFKVPYVHRNVATIDALVHYVQQWMLQRYRNYPILYLPMHGSADGVIHLGSGSRAPSVELDEIEEALTGQCEGRVFFFASCETLDIHGARLNRFLDRTGALAVCGYRGFVDWLASAALDLLVMGAFQHHKLGRAGLRRAQKQIVSDSGGLSRGLQFRMVVRE